MRLVKTEILIAAPVDKVWAALTAFDLYQQWNPFIVHGKGQASVGERLELTIQSKGKKSVTFRPIVTVVDHQRHLQWKGQLWVPGVFDGCHEFLLEPSGKTTCMIHRETFTGILPTLMGRQLDSVEEGFHALNAALNRRVCA